jgi:hypothetical protein
VRSTAMSATVLVRLGARPVRIDSMRERSSNRSMVAETLGAGAVAGVPVVAGADEHAESSAMAATATATDHPEQSAPPARPARRERSAPPERPVQPPDTPPRCRSATRSVPSEAGVTRPPPCLRPADGPQEGSRS